VTLGFAARATHHRVARTSRTITHKLVPYLLSAVEHPAVRLGFYTIRADQPEPDRSELLRGWGFLSDVQVPESEQHRIVGRLKRPRIKVDPCCLSKRAKSWVIWTDVPRKGNGSQRLQWFPTERLVVRQLMARLAVARKSQRVRARESAAGTGCARAAHGNRREGFAQQGQRRLS
jgi:hypothetical protein